MTTRTFQDPNTRHHWQQGEGQARGWKEEGNYKLNRKVLYYNIYFIYNYLLMLLYGKITSISLLLKSYIIYKLVFVFYKLTDETVS